MAEIPSAPVSSGKPAVNGLLVRVLTLAITGYQWLFSAWLGPSCRFVPSCSDYAIQALRIHGPLRGSWLAIRRLARCHPWGGSGLDEVPPCSHRHH